MNGIRSTMNYHKLNLSETEKQIVQVVLCFQIFINQLNMCYCLSKMLACVNVLLNYEDTLKTPSYLLNNVNSQSGTQHVVQTICTKNQATVYVSIDF